MRLQLHLTPNTEPVDFNHLHHLTGALHKWLGPNNIHDGLSLYSFGWLKGAKRENGHLTFPEGATWNVSFFDTDLAKQLLQGLMESPELAFGLGVCEVREILQPLFGEQFQFHTDGSVVIIRRPREADSLVYAV